jgi:hypothetical protein
MATETRAPIDLMLDGVVWRRVTEERPTGPDNSDGIPYATHEGALEIGGHSLRCYRLSNGQAVFHADDITAFFDDLTGEAQ